MIACISSAVGASTNAKPFDSCVSWFRMTLTESATRSSAASHCLMSSAVTQVGRLPRKTVKLIQLILLLRRLDFGTSKREDSDLIVAERARRLQTDFMLKFFRTSAPPPECAEAAPWPKISSCPE